MSPSVQAAWGGEGRTPLAFPFCLFFLKHRPCFAMEVSPIVTVNLGHARWALSKAVLQFGWVSLERNWIRGGEKWRLGGRGWNSGGIWIRTQSSRMAQGPLAGVPGHLRQRLTRSSDLADLTLGTGTSHSPPWAPGASLEIPPPSWRGLSPCELPGVL